MTLSVNDENTTCMALTEIDRRPEVDEYLRKLEFQALPPLEVGQNHAFLVLVPQSFPSGAQVTRVRVDFPDGSPIRDAQGNPLRQADFEPQGRDFYWQTGTLAQSGTFRMKITAEFDPKGSNGNTLASIWPEMEVGDDPPG